MYTWILISIVFFCTVYLYFYIYSLVNKTKIVHVKHTTEKHPLIRKKAPIFNFVLYKDIKNQLKERPSILIFVDQDCIHCNANVQNFLEAIQNRRNLNYAVVISNEQISKAKEINFLYPNIPILLVDREVFNEYQILLFPSYVLINSKGIIENITPVPFKIIS